MLAGVALKQMLFREWEANACRVDYLRLLGTRTLSSSSASNYRSSIRSHRRDAIDAAASLRRRLFDCVEVLTLLYIVEQGLHQYAVDAVT